MRHKREFLEDYLLKNYPTESKERIMKELDLSWNYIQKKSCLFKIERNIYESKCNNTISKLIDFSNMESCYWIGFLLADGHINNKNIIEINLSSADEQHLKKLTDFLSLSNKIHTKNSISRLTICDVITISKLSKIFKWETNKTKKPPTIPPLSYDQIFSLIIGFIDGDGSVSKDGIRIKCDISWKEIIEYFYSTLTKEYKTFDITSDGCSFVRIGSDHIKTIKSKAIELNLPILNRKWGKITERVLRKEKGEIVKNLLNIGKGRSEIKEETGFGYSLINSVIVKSGISTLKKKKYCFDQYDKGMSIKDVVNTGLINYLCAYRNYKKWESNK